MSGPIFSRGVNVFLCNCGAGLEVQVGWGQGAAGHVFQARPTGEVIDFSCTEYQPHYRGLGGGAAPPEPNWDYSRQKDNFLPRILKG